MAQYREEVAALAAPLVDADDLDVLLDRIGGARVVMLGGASHGTHEFYAWRAELTRRLIAECGFSFVAVEGDRPDLDRIDGTVRCDPGVPADPREALLTLEHWPAWIWANEEVLDLCRWLRGHNAGLPPARRVGFYGLDGYALWESLREILTYLGEHDPDQVPGALAAYRCFEPHGENPQGYAWSTRFVPQSGESEMVDRLVAMHEPEMPGAEHHYRALVRGGPKAWNVRERHMEETLAGLLGEYGDGARAVVWAHNTHVGDSRGTGQSAHGEVTIGELARERFGRDGVMLIGAGTHRGSLVACPSWGAPPEVFALPEAEPDSLEDVLHAAAPPRALMVFPPYRDRPDVLVDELGHRAIGVVHRPSYVPTELGERYDAFLWFDETTAVRPLRVLTSGPGSIV